jgi:hypothetical protein
VWLPGQILVDVEIRWRLESRVQQRQVDDAVDPEGTNGLAQVAVGHDVPPAPAVDQRVGVEVALQRFRLVPSPVNYRHPPPLAHRAPQLLQMRGQQFVVGPVHMSRHQRPPRPGHLVPLLVGEHVVEFGQRSPGGVLVQLAPHLSHLAGSQVHSDGLLRGEDQWGHLVASHQREAAVGTALGVDRDAHIVQHGNVAMNRTHGNAQLLSQFGRLLVGPPLQEHNQRDQSGGRVWHRALP